MASKRDEYVLCVGMTKALKAKLLEVAEAKGLSKSDIVRQGIDLQWKLEFQPESYGYAVGLRGTSPAQGVEP